VTKTLLSILLLSLLSSCGTSNEIQHTLANDAYRCEDFDITKEKMLILINNARRSARNCGYKIFTPAGEVTWNATLARAALNHSVDMAEKDFVSHKGSDGEAVSYRAEEVGYSWITVGENISAGREDSEEVVAAWLQSPDHCENIMRKSYTEIGAACFHNKDTKYKTFWTVVFGSPGDSPRSTLQ
jgi:uncharacterized protein YkwD